MGSDVSVLICSVQSSLKTGSISPWKQSLEIFIKILMVYLWFPMEICSKIIAHISQKMFFPFIIK
uniref:Uncharacterized protein n=1 Tax=Lepeophtheirus salmonis TaxID=72036 RepID=A0A0K2UGK3_LEPSM